MECDLNEDLILQLLLEDLNALEDQQKGKQAAGRQTDREIAIDTFKHELLALRTCNNDRTLAISNSRAIATDQKIIALIKQEESRAGQDRQYALSLDKNCDEQSVQAKPPIFGDATPNERSDDNNDAVSTIMGDMMDRLSMGDNLDNGEGSSRYFRSQTQVFTRECSSCFDKCDSMALQMPFCSHGFCRDCTKQMFLGAIKDEELYPPRCCGKVVPPETALRVLDYHELKAFGERAIEYTAKDRVYCAEPTCSKFIPPSRINYEHGSCPECRQQTHLPCRSLAHPGIDCPLDDKLQNVLALADMENWKRCFNCRTMVELQHGCNHITCRCGREFCYICGLVWKTCACPLWHENRLVAMANQAVEEEVAPNAGVAVRRAAFNRVVENLRRHEDIGCEHHRNSQWAWRDHGSLQCEICNYHLPEYIFMCKNCRMRACNTCRRHRLR